MSCMESTPFIRKSLDAVVQVLLELEADAALKRQDPAFIRSLLRQILKLEKGELPEPRK